MPDKLNIHDIMKHLDNKNYNYYNSLDDKEKKSLYPLIIMRWMSIFSRNGINAEISLLLINQVINKDLFLLYDYPDIQFKLLASCGLGITNKHSWFNGTKPKLKKDASLLFFEEVFPDANAKEINMIRKKYTKHDLIELLKDFGTTKKNSDEIINAYEHFRSQEAQSS